MNGHSCAFLLLEVFRLFPESEGVSGDVFEDVLGIGEVTRGAFVGIRKRVHLMPNLKGSPATDNCNRDIIREFGIRKGLKKLVISSKIRIFIGENQ